VKSGAGFARTTSATRRAPVLRFAVLASGLGLLSGLYEAGLLYFTPRMPGLVEPDISYAIWFLAPLTSLLCFAPLGALLGFATTLGKKRSHPWRASMLAATGLGAVGFYAALMVSLMQVWVADRFRMRLLTVPSGCFLAVYTAALILVRIRQRKRRDLFGVASSWTPRVLATLLLSAIVVSVGGLFIFSAQRLASKNRAAPLSAQPTPAPNIVLIVLDTVRADELSSYGYSRPTTPNIDRLASQGVLFENAISASSWTLPSTASILTGRLPHQHGANWSIPIASELQTLAEDLETHGYETAGFNANLGYGYAGWGLDQGFEVYDDDGTTLRHNLAATVIGRVAVQPLYRSWIHLDSFDRRNARDLNRDVFRWYNRRRSRRPFFLFINYFDAHYPYVTSPPFDGRFGRAPESILSRAVNFEYRGGVPKPLLAERGAVVTSYDNCLAFLDDQVGRLFDFLSRSPDWKNTKVIVTSDHGDAFGEHDAYGHGINLYRETTHVPLIFYGAGIPQGLRISHIARTREIFQTVIDLASGQSLRLDRSSLRRYWTPGARHVASDDSALSELISVVSLTTPEWHYLYHADGRSEFYHWPTDPHETNDLSGTPGQQGTEKALRALLEEKLSSSVPPWRGMDYLAGVGRLGLHSVLEQQVRLASSPAGESTRPLREDQDLLNTLPYH